MAEGFFERWSRRKQAQGNGEALPEKLPETLQDAQASQTPSISPDADTPRAAPMVDAGSVVRGIGQASPTLPADPAAEPPQARPAPTLADTESLTIASDFKPFVAREVAPEVKNAAFRKLFADPHFNQMDGLDTYIDDYSVTTPLPLSVLKQMASAKFLKLVEDDPPADGSAGGAADDRPDEISQKPSESPAPQAVAQSAPPEKAPSPPPALSADAASQTLDDDHADLRLQPDHAPRAARARDGTG